MRLLCSKNVYGFSGFLKNERITIDPKVVNSIFAELYIKIKQGEKFISGQVYS